jgi:hypothetical protein
MTILQTYHRFQVPPNVQAHMLLTADVIQLVKDHWTGGGVDWEITFKTVLLHDLGNLIKFTRPFIDPDLERNYQHWLAVQDKMVQKYGQKASHATALMIGELNFPDSQKIINLLEQMGQIMSSDKSTPVSIEARLVEYADTVVTPKGVEGFEMRIKDLTSRYQKTDQDWSKGLRENAELIQQNVSFDVFGELGEMIESDSKRDSEKLSIVLD